MKKRTFFASIFVMAVLLFSLTSCGGNESKRIKVENSATLPDNSRGLKAKYLAPTGEKAAGANWLFTIGINDYTKWPVLKTAVNDARSLKDVLLKRYEYKKENIVELYNKDATREKIIEKLRYLAQNLKNDDSLFIFYAGHGHIDSITKEGSWIPVDSDTKNSAAWVSNHDIKKYLSVDVIKAKHLLLISDSCFSGDFFRGKRGKLPEVTSEVIKKAYKLTSRQAITSGGLEPVSDAGFGNNSVFSHFLIKTLKENRKPFLIPSELFPDVKAGVAENAEQFPRFGTLKGTGGQQGGEIVLFLKQNNRLAELKGEKIKKSEELERLRKLEAEAKAAKAREEAEIAKRDKELAAMDAKIAAMKKRLGTSSAREDDSLQNMLAMVEHKEAQERRLIELKKQKEREAQRRAEEIQRIKDEEARRELTALKKDIAAYRKIISSKYGKDMKAAAWKSLANKYPERSKGIMAGDTKALVSSGWLSVNTRPSNAEITLLNSHFKYKRGMRISSGYYNLKVSAEDHVSKSINVYIAKGSKTTKSVKLIKSKFTNSIGQKFVYIRPGLFMMRSNSGNSYEKPVHSVRISTGFFMQTTEVTQRQWRSVMGNNPSNFRGENRPVEEVSWNDVKNFIRRLNSREGTNRYRLPTEAEWEYAARAGSSSKYSFGSSEYDLGVYAWYDKNSGNRTHDVGTKHPNRWGLYDMHGNVWEWCSDWYGKYSYSSKVDPTGPYSGSYRVYRGGGFSSSARYCRSAYRGRLRPGFRLFGIGFRLVCLSE